MTTPIDQPEGKTQPKKSELACIHLMIEFASCEVTHYGKYTGQFHMHFCSEVLIPAIQPAM